MTQPESTETYERVGGNHLPKCNDRCRGDVHWLGPVEANVPAVDPARVAVYAEAIRSRPWGGVPAGLGDWYLELAGAVVGVADAELAEVRAEVERLTGSLEIALGHLMEPGHPEDVARYARLHIERALEGKSRPLILQQRRAETAERESASRGEQIVTLVDDRAVWRERALLAEARVRAVEQAMERRSVLHPRWNGAQELVVSVVDLRAALAAASPDGGGLDLSDEEFAGFQAAVNDEPVTGLDGRLHGPDGPGSPSCTCGNVYGSVERLSGHLVWAASRLAEGGE